MADEPREQASSSGNSAGRPRSVSRDGQSLQSPGQQDDRGVGRGESSASASTASANPPVATDDFSFTPHPIARSSTTTPRRGRALWDGASSADGGASAGRRRGNTLSAGRPSESSASPRPPMRDIAEERPPRQSTQSQRSDGSGMRLRRAPTTRQRASTLGRRPTVITTGRSAVPADAQSMFSLSGPGPQDAPAVHQHTPYVDPGYSQLNPAYEQPVNQRPVWGLAKPLPRVIRPGMVPTGSEVDLNQANQAQNGVRPGAGDPDVEKGRVEPTLKLGKISTHLRDARETRENKFLKRVGTGLSRPLSHISEGASSQPFSPGALPSHVEEEEEEGERWQHDSAAADLELEPIGSPKLGSATGGPGLTQGELDEDRLARQYREQDPNGFPDDASSAVTANDDDADGAYAPGELDLQAFGTDDEIHNHHTHWSVVRTRFREPLAELLAVIVQLTFGFCADLAVTCGGSSAGNGTTTDFAWGFSTMIGIYIAGGISGAHLNPAITIMLYVYRGFPARKMPAYIIAQLLGAFIAGLIAFGLYRSAIIEYGGADLAAGGTMDAFITNPRHAWTDPATAFFTEFVGTAFLAVAVLALGDDTNAPPGAGMSAFVLGLVIYIECNAFGYNTGAALNGTRDLGPRLALLAVGYGRGTLFGDSYWFYGPWVATVTGAVVGAGLYDVAIFVGGESPINYPRRRIRRAGHKWRKRWGRRLRGKKIEDDLR
ncbi:Uu.00g145350.m01.CDS01 [Anthostomella pinea]|uniref:Uu.00g145350.m01.CDS01 n=1 Tax=Anthostomella pinea TaxID=933095 RepID=A0AAI8VRU6_9PEZI|nr:Uu.00g145350.m01.CDS01 [Anthostomella pinea]